MSLRQRQATAVLICMVVALTGLAVFASRALAEDCADAFVRSSIAGEGSRVKLGLEGQTTGCGSSSIQKITHEPQPYFTYEVSCSTDRRAATEGLCSTTPCPDFGRFFAFRTIHRPDGSSEPAGFSCVSLEQAVATPV